MLNDGNYAPIGRDISLIDVPFVQETSYDYDDMNGVIDDVNNPYDQTIPILVSMPIIAESNSVLERLGNKCKICNVTNPLLLSVRSIRNSQRRRSPKQLKELAEKMIECGKDPTKEFCVLCLNCNMLRTKMINARQDLGTENKTIDDLKQEL